MTFWPQAGRADGRATAHRRLTVEQELEILRRVRAGETRRAIGAALDLNPVTVGKVARRHGFTYPGAQRNAEARRGKTLRQPERDWQQQVILLAALHRWRAENGARTPKTVQYSQLHTSAPATVGAVRERGTTTLEVAMHPQDITSSPAELWRPVIGYEGIYSVSNQGRVRRDGVGRGTRGQPLRATPTNKGYLRVGLVVQGRQVTRLVHHLVAEAFLGPRPPGLVLNHQDGVKTHNRPENLEYVSYGANNAHAYQIGVKSWVWNGHQPPRGLGAANPRARLTEADVRAIRASGEFERVLAGRYGVAQSTINAIRQRKIWRHIE